MSAMENLKQWIDRVVDYWENLTERERLLLVSFGGLVATLLVLIPFVILMLDTRAAAAESDAIMEVVDEITRSKEKLVEKVAERKALERRYAVKAPDLGAFVEDNGRQVGLSVDRTTTEPTATVGKYERRSVRVDLPNVELAPAIRLMGKVQSSRHPVVVNKIEIDHSHMGENKFTVRMGVVAFDKEDDARTRDKTTE